jgi:hypothetical protein
VKPFAIWLAIVAVVFGGYALISSSLQETSRVFVVRRRVSRHGAVRRRRSVASSTASTTAATPSSPWRALSSRRSDSGLVHSWQPAAALVRRPTVRPVLVRRHRVLRGGVRRRRRILVTTSPRPTAACDAGTLVDWEIVLLDP